MNLTASSQTITLSKAGDTLICFSLNQSKFILKKIAEAQEFKTLDSLCEEQANYYKAQIYYYNKVNSDQSLIIKNDAELVNLKDTKIKLLNQELTEQNKKTRIQKVYKIAAMVGEGALSVFLGCRLITKK